MKIGPYHISTVVSHHFALDGGAMFGVVPKVMWEKLIAADERNRIPLVTRLLVLESADAKVLIDLGCGDKLSPKLSEIYACTRKSAAPLHELLTDITHVLITHLHFDHVGGVSYFDSAGALALSFPTAEHIISRRHWDYAKAPNPREKASFFTDNLQPLREAKLRLVNSGEEVLPHIRVWESNGHTTAMCWAEIFSAERTVVFPSDVMPTSHHVPLPYLMGYDMCATTMIEEKRQFLARAVHENWVVVFEHDRDVTAATLQMEHDRAAIREIVSLPDYLGR